MHNKNKHFHMLKAIPTFEHKDDLEISKNSLPDVEVE